MDHIDKFTVILDVQWWHVQYWLCNMTFHHISHILSVSVFLQHGESHDRKAISAMRDQLQKSECTPGKKKNSSDAASGPLESIRGLCELVELANIWSFDSIPSMNPAAQRMVFGWPTEPRCEQLIDGMRRQFKGWKNKSMKIRLNFLLFWMKNWLIVWKTDKPINMKSNFLGGLLFNEKLMVWWRTRSLFFYFFWCCCLDQSGCFHWHTRHQFALLPEMEHRTLPDSTQQQVNIYYVQYFHVI